MPSISASQIMTHTALSSVRIKCIASLACPPGNDISTPYPPVQCLTTQHCQPHALSSCVVLAPQASPIRSIKNPPYSQPRLQDPLALRVQLHLGTTNLAQEHKAYAFLASLHHCNLSNTNVIWFLGNNYTGVYCNISQIKDQLFLLGIDEPLITQYARVMSLGCSTTQQLIFEG